MFTEEKPIFIQLAEKIADGIMNGDYLVDTPVPSTNELAAFYRINPATAGKALNLLVEAGILYKRRGLGMYVSSGAKELLTTERKSQFASKHIAPMLQEAKVLGLSTEQIIELILREEN